MNNPFEHKEVVDSLYETFVKQSVKPEILPYITHEQKCAVLKALDVNIEVLSENSIKTSWLFVNLTLSVDKDDNADITMSIDIGKLMEYTNAKNATNTK